MPERVIKFEDLNLAIDYYYDEGDRGDRETPPVDPSVEIQKVSIYRSIGGSKRMIDITKEFNALVSCVKIEKLENMICKLESEEVLEFNPY